MMGSWAPPAALRPAVPTLSSALINHVNELYPALGGLMACVGAEALALACMMPETWPSRLLRRGRAPAQVTVASVRRGIALAEDEAHAVLCRAVMLLKEAYFDGEELGELGGLVIAEEGMIIDVFPALDTRQGAVMEQLAAEIAITTADPASAGLTPQRVHATPDPADCPQGLACSAPAAFTAALADGSLAARMTAALWGTAPGTQAASPLGLDMGPPVCDMGTVVGSASDGKDAQGGAWDAAFRASQVRVRRIAIRNTGKQPLVLCGAFLHPDPLPMGPVLIDDMGLPGVNLASSAAVEDRAVADDGAAGEDVAGAGGDGGALGAASPEAELEREQDEVAEALEREAVRLLVEEEVEVEEGAGLADSPETPEWAKDAVAPGTSPEFFEEWPSKCAAGPPKGNAAVAGKDGGVETTTGGAGPGRPAVLLEPGAVHFLTVAVRGGPGATLGVHEFTLVAVVAPQERDGPPSALELASRRVVFAVSSSAPASSRRELDPEVEGFVAPSLRAVFDTPCVPLSCAHVMLFPTQALSPGLPLASLACGLNARQVPPGVYPPESPPGSGRFLGPPFLPASAAPLAMPAMEGAQANLWPGPGARPAAAPSTVRALRRLTRLLALEEATTAVHLCGLDAFECRLRAAVVPVDAAAAPRRVYVLPPFRTHDGAIPSLAAVVGTESVADPNQAAALARACGEPFSSCLCLGVIDVPGQPEKQPDLYFGFSVHLRMHRPQVSVEHACMVVGLLPATATGPPSALLLLPTQLRQWLASAAVSSTSGADAPLVHVRFSFDRMPFVRMTRALSLVARAVNDLDVSHAIGAAEGLEVEPADMLHVPKAACDLVRAAAQACAGLEERNAERAGGPQRLNDEQRAAVAAVLASASGDVPFALFGPPGTGKTLTLVEMALQVLHRDSNSRILLAATAENYSADIFCDCLRRAGVGTDVMVRVNDPRWPMARTMESILLYCLLDVKPAPNGSMVRTGFFRLPSLDELASKRVVVVTCGVAGLLSDLLILQGAHLGDRSPVSFSHVLVDEAGQATAPEVLQALVHLRLSGTAVLAGDPKQLGPVVRSAYARSRGLHVSLLEGLMMGADMAREQDVPPYWSNVLADPGADAATVAERWRARAESATALGARWLPWARPGRPRPAAIVGGALLRNYRSRAELLRLSSSLFYGGRLIAAAPQQALQSVSWAPGPAPAPGCVRPGVAIAFHGVYGRQMRSNDVPSFFNAAEVDVLAGMVRSLLDHRASGEEPVRVEDVGVLAPYRKQVQKIRIRLRQDGLGSVRVGTVDDYQGQEHRYLFISTVLTRPESLPGQLTLGRFANRAGGADSKGNAGVPGGVAFWASPNRFNVAISRARSMLIVVGHPLVLAKERNWSHLLRYCAREGTWTGEGWEEVGSAMAGEGSAGSGQGETFRAWLARRAAGLDSGVGPSIEEETALYSRISRLSIDGGAGTQDQGEDVEAEEAERLVGRLWDDAGVQEPFRVML